MISAFEKPDFHVITSRCTMDKTLIISIIVKFGMNEERVKRKLGAIICADAVEG